MVSRRERESLLAEQYVASFAKLDDLRASPVTDPIGWRLAEGEEDGYGRKRWRPIHVQTDFSLLEPVYTKLPGRFPPLYERLVLSYRWAEVDLESYSLLANPPGPDLSGLLAEISKDPGLWNALAPAGYIPFGKGAGGDYDPVCFDWNLRKKNRDCRVVKIDHEEILCNNRIRVVAELAPSFEILVRETIQKASKRG